MSVLIGGISCDEIVKGYGESIDPTPQSTKSYLCPWFDRYRVAQGMIGFATATSRNGAISFNAPFTHPEASGLYAKSIAIRPVGMPTQGPRQLAFAGAIIEVTFGVLSWAALPEDDPAGDQGIDPDTKFLYATQEIDYAAEYHTVPGSSLVYGDGESQYPLNQDRPIKVAHAEMSITLHKLPYMPVNFLPLIDHVNKNVFLGCASETVKFNGGKTHREQQSDGSITQSVSFSFSYRPGKGWNTIPDPKGGSTWVNFRYKDQKPVFVPDDLSQVFPRYYIY